MADLLTLPADERVNQQTTPLLKDTVAPNTLDTTQAENLAYKTSFIRNGIYQPMTDVSTLQNQFSIGEEEDIRRDLVAQDRAQQYATNEDLLKAYGAGRIAGTIPQEEMDGFIKAYQNGPIEKDPETILEEKYGEKFSSTVAALMSSNEEFGKYVDVNKIEFLDELDVASDLVTKKEIALGTLQDLTSAWSNQGLISKSWDYLKQLVPVYSWWHTQNVVEGSKAFATSLLPGANKREQYQYLYLQTPSEFKRLVKATAEELAKDNTLEAINFIQGVYSYSTSDSYVDDVFGVADVGDVTTPFLKPLAVAGVGMATVRATKALRRLRRGATAVSDGSVVSTPIEELLAAPEAPKAAVAPSATPEAPEVDVAAQIARNREFMQKFGPRPGVPPRVTPAEAVQTAEDLYYGVTPEVDLFGNRVTAQGKSSWATPSYEIRRRITEGDKDFEKSPLGIAAITSEESFIKRVGTLLDKNFSPEEIINKFLVVPQNTHLASARDQLEAAVGRIRATRKPTEAPGAPSATRVAQAPTEAAVGPSEGFVEPSGKPSDPEVIPNTTPRVPPGAVILNDGSIIESGVIDAGLSKEERNLRLNYPKTRESREFGKREGQPFNPVLATLETAYRWALDTDIVKVIEDAFLRGRDFEEVLKELGKIRGFFKDMPSRKSQFVKFPITARDVVRSVQKALQIPTERSAFAIWRQQKIAFRRKAGIPFDPVTFRPSIGPPAKITVPTKPEKTLEELMVEADERVKEQRMLTYESKLPTGARIDDLGLRLDNIIYLFAYEGNAAADPKRVPLAGVQSVAKAKKTSKTQKLGNLEIQGTGAAVQFEKGLTRGSRGDLIYQVEELFRMKLTSSTIAENSNLDQLMKRVIERLRTSHEGLMRNVSLGTKSFQGTGEIFDTDTALRLKIVEVIREKLGIPTPSDIGYASWAKKNPPNRRTPVTSVVKEIRNLRRKITEFKGNILKIEGKFANKYKIPLNDDNMAAEIARAQNMIDNPKAEPIAQQLAKNELASLQEDSSNLVRYRQEIDDHERSLEELYTLRDTEAAVQAPQQQQTGAVEQFPEGLSGDQLRRQQEMMATRVPEDLPPLQGAAADIARGATGPVPDPANALASAGNLDAAADVLVRKAQLEREVPTVAQQRVMAGDPFKSMIEFFKDVPSLYNPLNWMNLRRVLANGRKNLILDRLEKNRENLLGLLTAVTKVQRIPAAALEIGIAETKKELSSRYFNIKNSFLDVSYGGPFDIIKPEFHNANLTTVHLKLGTPDAQLFRSPDHAYSSGTILYGLDPDSFRVERQGAGYYIQVSKYVDETKDSVRAAWTESNNKTPTSLANALFGFVRSADDLLSPLASSNRKTVTYGSNEIQRLMADSAAALRNISTADRKKLSALIEDARDRVVYDVDENGKQTARRGEYYENIMEFDNEWRTKYTTPPSDLVRAAYLSYIQLNDIDWVIRNWTILSDKARMGMENITFSFKFTSNKTGQQFSKNVKDFEGALRDKLPYNVKDFDASIWMYDDATGQGKLVRKNAMTEVDKQLVKVLTEQKGYKIVEIANPIERPLSRLAGTDDIINYAIVKNPIAKPIGWKNIPRRPGGHIEHLAPVYIKQPKIRRVKDEQGRLIRHEYEGDTSILNLETDAEGMKWAKAFEEARKIYKSGDMQGLIRHLETRLPMYTAEAFTKMFQDSIDDAGKVKPALLSLDDEISWTRTGQNIADKTPELSSRYENFENVLRSPFNMYNNINKEYAGSRGFDLMTISEGTEADPITKLVRPRLMDPYDTLTRALGNVMRNRLASDYKIFAIESFFNEFGSIMSKNREELFRNPMEYLHNPPYNLQTSTWGQRRIAENARLATINLLGESTTQSKMWDWVQQKLLDSIYTSAGQRASNWVAANVLPKIKDPTRYVRNIAFRLNMGFWNPVQIFKQGHTLTHIAALGYKDVFQSGSAGTMFRFLALRDDENMINFYAKKAEAFGWNKEDFKESYNQFRKTGLYIVEGESSWRDDQIDPRMFSSGATQFLDKSTVFFKGTERWLRMTAWNVAFREWRRQNPTKVMDNAARQQVVDRTETLTVNMSRASSARIQNGITSPMFQFFGYQMRLMDQMLGKRLTKAEKARVFGVYSAMYGIPIGTTGVALGVYPWYEDIRQDALERGVNFDNKAIDAIYNGIPAMLQHLITGKEYAVGEAYGPGGLSFIKDYLRGDKTAFEIFTGASGSVLQKMFESVSPSLMVITSLGKADYLPPTYEDFLEVARNIKTIDVAQRTYQFSNIAAYMTKNESYITETDNMDALMSAFGMQPRKATDTFLMIESLKERQNAQKNAEPLFIKEYRRAIGAAMSEDMDAYRAHYSRAKAYFVAGGWNEYEMIDLIEKALEGYESMEDKISGDFLKRAPQGQWAPRLERQLGIPSGSLMSDEVE